MRAVRAISMVALACATIGARSESAECQSASAKFVAFQHGVNSDPSTWFDMRSALRNEFLMMDFGINTNSQTVYEEQGRTLLDGLSASGIPAGILAVGHSNGGVVIREAARQDTSRAAFAAYVSVGSPMQGAALMYAVTSGRATSMFHWIADGVAAPLVAYQWYNDNWVYDYAMAFGAYVHSLIAYIDTWVIPLAFKFFPYSGVPLAEEMSGVQPGGALAVLNSGANLLREDTVFQARVNVVSSFSSNDNLLFRTFGAPSEAAAARLMVELTQVLYLGAADYYSSLWLDDASSWEDYQYLTSHAYLWVEGAWYLSLLDAMSSMMS